MAIWNKKFYETRKHCTNCDKDTVIKVPNGVSINDFILSGRALCQNCGCSIVRIVEEQPTPIQQPPESHLPPLPVVPTHTTPPLGLTIPKALSRKGRGRPKKKEVKKIAEPVEEPQAEQYTEEENSLFYDETTGKRVLPW